MPLPLAAHLGSTGRRIAVWRHRLRGLATAAAIAALTGAGCSQPSLAPDRVDPVCQGRADALDCQAALEAVVEAHGFAFELEDHDIRAGSIACDLLGCSTWIQVTPPASECLPIWVFHADRPLIGAWKAAPPLHGHPDCPVEE